MNFSTSSFRIHQNNDEYDPHHHPNHRVSSSSSSSSSSSVACHIFFNSSTQDRMGYYDHHYLYRPRQQEVENYAYLSGSSYEMKNKAENGLKLTLWKKEVDEHEPHIPDNTNNNYVKWNSNTKTSLTKKKIKKPEDRKGSKITTFEDEKMQPSSSLETDLSSKSDSYNNNSPIRVCADCNTTKTPLWRSGPKGPKSLCNACGIRQRKARRAMAAAASGTGVATTQPPPTKIKLQQHKEKIAKIGHASKLTKRRKNIMANTNINTTTNTTKSLNGQKRLRFEDFLINLSKNLSFHRVFPDDEKDAAILLMAISSGVFHG